MEAWAKADKRNSLIFRAVFIVCVIVATGLALWLTSMIVSLGFDSPLSGPPRDTNAITVSTLE